jgi:DNA-binding NtrC family response regulator
VLPADVLTRWEDDPWPGNVRQLRNAVIRYLALGELEQAPASPETPRTRTPADAGFIEEVLAAGLPLSEARDQVLQEFERLYVERALSESGGNVTRAARASGVGRRHFQYLKARRGPG